MNVRKPLVVVNGQVQELPVGDISYKFPLICDTVDIGEVLTIPSTYQLLVSTKLNNNGTISNSGRLVIL